MYADDPVSLQQGNDFPALALQISAYCRYEFIGKNTFQRNDN